MAEVQPADPRARRAALALLVVGFGAGGALLWGLEAGRPAIAEWLRAEPARTAMRARLLLAVLAVMTSGPAVVAGMYLWHLGSRMIAAERFPPPGLRMVQDTIVLTGQPARSRGRLFQALGFVLFLAGGTIAALLATLMPR